MLQARAEDMTLVLFHYIPNKPLAIVGLVVFLLFAIYLTARVYMSKSARFLYILPITALLECVGYLIRIMCSDFTDLGRYVGMTLFLLLPPNALALVNYKAVGEIIRLSNVQAKHFYLRPKFVTWFFFSSDVFSFLMQGSGGGLQSTGSDMGITITLIGLALQLVFFACFALITIHVHRNPEYNYRIEGQPNAKRNLTICLCITLALLYVRSIYRVAEYATGYNGSIASLEWAFYVFDRLAVALSFATYSILFIGNYLPKRGEVSGDLSTAIKTAYSASSLDNLNQLENGIEMHTNNNKYTTSNF